MQTYIDSINSYAEAISSMNVEAFAGRFAPNAEMYDPADGPAFRGREGAAAFFLQFAPLLESVQFVPGSIYVTGNQAAFTWSLTAKGKNGRTATAEGIDAVVFDAEGRFETLRAYWNPGPFAGALMA